MSILASDPAYQKASEAIAGMDPASALQYLASHGLNQALAIGVLEAAQLKRAAQTQQAIQGAMGPQPNVLQNTHQMFQQMPQQMAQQVAPQAMQAVQQHAADQARQGGVADLPVNPDLYSFGKPKGMAKGGVVALATGGNAGGPYGVEASTDPVGADGTPMLAHDEQGRPLNMAIDASGKLHNLGAVPNMGEYGSLVSRSNRPLNDVEKEYAQSQYMAHPTQRMQTTTPDTGIAAGIGSFFNNLFTSPSSYEERLRQREQAFRNPSQNQAPIPPEVLAARQAAASGAAPSVPPNAAAPAGTPPAAPTNTPPTNAAPTAPNAANVSEQTKNVLRIGGMNLDESKDPLIASLEQHIRDAQPKSIADRIREQREALGPNAGVEEYKKALDAQSGMAKMNAESQMRMARAGAFFNMAMAAGQPGQAGNGLTKFLNAAATGGLSYSQAVPHIQQGLMAAQQKIAEDKFRLADAQRREDSEMLRDASREYGADQRNYSAMVGDLAKFKAQEHAANVRTLVQEAGLNARSKQYNDTIQAQYIKADAAEKGKFIQYGMVGADQRLANAKKAYDNAQLVAKNNPAMLNQIETEYKEALAYYNAWNSAAMQHAGISTPTPGAPTKDYSANWK